MKTPLKTRAHPGGNSSVSGHWYLLCSILAAGAIGVLGLAVPLLTLLAYDKLIPAGSTSTLYWLSVGTATAIVFEGFLRYCQSQITSWYKAFNSFNDANSYFMRRLETYRLQHHGDDLVADQEVFDAIQRASSFRANGLLQAGLELPFTAFYLTIMFKLSGPVFYGNALLLGLYLLTTCFFTLGRFSSRRRLRKTEHATQESLITILKSSALIKSAAIERQQCRTYESFLSDHYSRQFRSLNWMSLFDSLSSCVQHAAQLGTVFLGSYFALSGDLSIGVVTACMMLSGRAAHPVIQFSKLSFRFIDYLHDRRKIRAAYRSLVPLTLSAENQLHQVNTQSVQADASSTQQSHDWSWLWHFKGNLIYEANVGECIAVEASTATASTQLMVNSTFLLKQQAAGTSFLTPGRPGDVVLLGSSERVFQGSVWENLTGYRNTDPDRILHLCRSSGLESAIANLPSGYETQLDRESNKRLEQSLIQQIAIVRALSQKPRLVILDHADHGFDSSTLQGFIALLGEMRRECAVVIASSNVETLRQASRALRLRGDELEKGNLEDWIKGLERKGGLIWAA